MSNSPTLYDLLRVPADAPEARIRSAFRQRMAELDQPGFVAEADLAVARRRLELAHSTLTDATLRAAYDDRLARVEESRAEARAAKTRRPAHPGHAAAAGPAEPSRRRWWLLGLGLPGLAAVAFFGLQGQGKGAAAVRIDPQHDAALLQAAENRLELQAFHKATGLRAASRDEMELLRRQLEADKARKQATARAEQEAERAAREARRSAWDLQRHETLAEEQQRRAEAREREAFMREREEEEAFRRRANR